jgi:hypothetical protein
LDASVKFVSTKQDLQGSENTKKKKNRHGGGGSDGWPMPNTLLYRVCACVRACCSSSLPDPSSSERMSELHTSTYTRCLQMLAAPPNGYRKAKVVVATCLALAGDGRFGAPWSPPNCMVPVVWAWEGYMDHGADKATPLIPWRPLPAAQGITPRIPTLARRCPCGF